MTKLGAAYTTGDWTFRGGYSYVTQPIPDDQTFLNIYAPGVVQHHLTLGATWAVSKTGELSMSYMHAFKETVKGSGSIPSIPYSTNPMTAVLAAAKPTSACTRTASVSPTAGSSKRQNLPRAATGKARSGWSGPCFLPLNRR